MLEIVPGDQGRGLVQQGVELIKKLIQIGALTFRIEFDQLVGAAQLEQSMGFEQQAAFFTEQGGGAAVLQLVQVVGQLIQLVLQGTGVAQVEQQQDQGVAQFRLAAVAAPVGDQHFATHEDAFQQLFLGIV